MQNFRYPFATLVLSIVVGGVELDAKTKHQKAEPAQPQDQIVVESHIKVASGPVTRFMATRHYNRSYVYAERKAGEPVTLIDVTDLAHPAIVSEAAWNGASGPLLAAAGTAVLAGEADTASMSTPRTISLMDLSDPAQPKVTKQFDGVTAIEKLANGSVILLANKDGVWILKQHFAEDPAAQERYAREVIYGQSMY